MFLYYGDKSHLVISIISLSLHSNLLMNMNAKITLEVINERTSKKELTDCMNSLSGISNVKIYVMEINATFDYTTHNALEGLREELKGKGYRVVVE